MLRVTDWNIYFENNRTRELRYLDWVPVPNRMDGDGYVELLDHENGTAHFGAWNAILQVASRCEIRGTLLRDGCMAHNAESIARKSRTDPKMVREVIPRLIKIGWLEEVDDAKVFEELELQKSRTDVGTIPQEGAEKRLRNGTERNGTERNKSHAAHDSSAIAKRNAKPPEDASPVILVFPCAGSVNAWNLTQAIVDELRPQFPAVDIIIEGQRALGWLKANHLKTAGGMKRFIWAWMSRSQNSARAKAQSNQEARRPRGTELERIANAHVKPKLKNALDDGALHDNGGSDQHAKDRIAA